MGHDKSERKRMRYEQSGDQIYVQGTLKYEKYEPQNCAKILRYFKLT